MPAKPKNKSKIIAVSLDNTTLNFDDTEGVEPNFDKVMEDVKLDDVQPDDVKIEIPINEKKPRAKAKPKAKPVVEPDVEPIVEPIEEAPLKTEKKQIELVECPDCKKKLSAKTYKYNHVHNCPAKRFTPQQLIQLLHLLNQQYNHQNQKYNHMILNQLRNNHQLKNYEQ